eukprot:9851032-Karenia_brevis.AAC.1
MSGFHKKKIRDRRGDILIKADQEEAMKYLVKGTGDERVEGRTVVEEAHVAVKGSNGVVEKA